MQVLKKYAEQKIVKVIVASDNTFLSNQIDVISHIETFYLQLQKRHSDINLSNNNEFFYNETKLIDEEDNIFNGNGHININE